MPSGYVKFVIPTILHSGLERFRNDIPESEFEILQGNGYLFEYQENPDEIQNKRLYFHEKYNSTLEPEWVTYIISYQGYRIAIGSHNGPIEETTHVLPEYLFEI